MHTTTYSYQFPPQVLPGTVAQLPPDQYLDKCDRPIVESPIPCYSLIRNNPIPHSPILSTSRIRRLIYIQETQVLLSDICNSVPGRNYPANNQTPNTTPPQDVPAPSAMANPCLTDIASRSRNTLHGETYLLNVTWAGGPVVLRVITWVLTLLNTPHELRGKSR